MQSQSACFNGTKKITFVLNVLAIMASVPFTYYIARPDTFCLQFFTAGFVFLLVLPYLLFILNNYFLVQSGCQAKLLFFVSLTSIIGAAAAFYYAFIVNYNGQNGLYLVIVPFAQIALAVIAALMNWKCKSVSHA